MTTRCTSLSLGEGGVGIGLRVTVCSRVQGDLQQSFGPPDTYVKSRLLRHTDTFSDSRLFKI